MKNLWNRLFLEERPSLSLSFFRVVVAMAVGLHLIPTFFHLDDNWFSTALKTYDFSFFTPGFIEWIQKSPDPLVFSIVVIFCVSWLFFLIGLFSHISCLVMTACCYYFYALNSFAIGRILTWDILMVTLFLMCVTPYPGDYFSVDCLRRGDRGAYKRRRPYFLQRLLQMQIGFTYFYTALYKIMPAGNWLTDNPIYYLMKYPPMGVTKNFMIKEFMAAHPQLCYVMGILIVVIEFAMLFLLFFPRTRISAIYLGIVFHITLMLTLDVPAIFFFLFPPQLLLFIHPDRVIAWIEQKRRANQQTRRSRLVYDGHCGFCRSSVLHLEIMDLFETVELIDYQSHADLKKMHPDLTKEAAHSQLHLVEPDGTLYGGFAVFRRLCLTLPMLYPMIPVFYFPGSGVVGPRVYQWVAKNRYLFHFNKACQTNACFR